MYNRYIPGSDGIYKRHQIITQTPLPEQKACAENNSACSVAVQTPPKFINSHGKHDIGDLLLLCIVILILLDSEEDDMLTILITVAAYLFLQ